MCGTESFYIIPNDPIAHPTAVEDNVTLLAKYNLNVGSDLVDGVLGIQNKKAIGMQYDSDSNEDYTSCNFTTEQINDFFGGAESRADDDCIDFYNDGFGCNGTLPFSTTDYWDGVRNRTFVYNENSLLYPYVEDYKKYIQTFGLNVKETSIPGVNQIYNAEVENTVNIFENKCFWTGNVHHDEYNLFNKFKRVYKKLCGHL